MLVKVKKLVYDAYLKNKDLVVQSFTAYLYNDGPTRLLKNANGCYTLTTMGITIVDFDNMEFGNYELELYKNNKLVAII